MVMSILSRFKRFIIIFIFKFSVSSFFAPLLKMNFFLVNINIVVSEILVPSNVLFSDTLFLELYSNN